MYLPTTLGGMLSTKCWLISLQKSFGFSAGDFTTKKQNETKQKINTNNNKINNNFCLESNHYLYIYEDLDK